LLLYFFVISDLIEFFVRKRRNPKAKYGRIVLNRGAISLGKHVLTGESARIFEEKAALNAANAHKLDFAEEIRWVEAILRKSGMN
jgi:hypothetical protein